MLSDIKSRFSTMSNITVSRNREVIKWVCLSLRAVITDSKNDDEVNCKRKQKMCRPLIQELHGLGGVMNGMVRNPSSRIGQKMCDTYSTHF